MPLNEKEGETTVCKHHKADEPEVRLFPWIVIVRVCARTYSLIHTFIPSEYLPVGLTNVTTQICMQTISKVNDMQEQVQMCVLLFFPKICVGCVCFFTNHRMDAKPAVFAFVDSVSAMPGFPASGVSVCVCVRARGGEVVSSVQSVHVGF